MGLLRGILAAVIAIGIPGLFLLIIYTLDLYASSTFHLVLYSFVWGGVGGVGLAYLVNTYITIPWLRYHSLDYLLLYIVFAPIAEEVFKSLSLLYVARRPEFTYFVDGAIYGFASGIGFSITENFLYMAYYPGRPVALAFVRAFSVCLMHGTTTGLVGVAVGRFRLLRKGGQGLALVAGWIAAMSLHALFNSISQTGVLERAVRMPLQITIGLAGVGLIVLFIWRGLREERRWIVEMLSERVGITAAEINGAQAAGTYDLDEALRPILRQFPKEAQQIESYLLRRAQAGIKSGLQRRLKDPELKEKIGREIERLEEEVTLLRQGMGICSTSYIECVFPEDDSETRACLEEMVACQAPPDLLVEVA